MREDSFLNNLMPIKSDKNMPFTVSHTVAVIPLYKYLGKFGALSALIIGSMTPDFAYMTPYLVDQRMDSHSLVGIYLYAIPMGLTVYFLYHFLMAPVLVSLLPQFIKKYLHRDLFLGKIPNIPSYTLVFSLIIGALTHIIWDFFTHQTGIPQYIPWMDVPLTAIDGYNIMPYRVLQHFSSLFGLSLLLFWVWRWIALKKHNGNNDNKDTLENNLITPNWKASKKLIILSLLTILISSAIFGTINGAANMTGDTVMYGLYDAQLFVRYGIVGAAGAFIITSALLGIIYQVQIHRFNRNHTD